MSRPRRKLTCESRVLVDTPDESFFLSDFYFWKSYLSDFVFWNSYLSYFVFKNSYLSYYSQAYITHIFPERFDLEVYGNVPCVKDPHFLAKKQQKMPIFEKVEYWGLKDPLEVRVQHGTCIYMGDTFSSHFEPKKFNRVGRRGLPGRCDPCKIIRSEMLLLYYYYVTLLQCNRKKWKKQPQSWKRTTRRILELENLPSNKFQIINSLLLIVCEGTRKNLSSMNLKWINRIF